MNLADKATAWMVAIANDDSHGYDQVDRIGKISDYDCSGFNTMGWELAGVPVRSKYGANTTRDIEGAYKKAGFKDVTASITLSNGNGLKPNDVLLAPGKHVAQVVSVNPITIVHASINELGKVTGGKHGDQTGKEICVRTYYNHPWKIVLRYNEDSNAPVATVVDTKSLVKKGQKAGLEFLGISKIDNKEVNIDGIRGPVTKKLGIMVLQKAMNLDYNVSLDIDGIFGPLSDKALGRHYVERGETQYLVTAVEILLYLLGKDPNGIEVPGIYGGGLERAAGVKRVSAEMIKGYLK